MTDAPAHLQLPLTDPRGGSPFPKRTKKKPSHEFTPREKTQDGEVCGGRATREARSEAAAQEHKDLDGATQSPSASESANFSSHLTSNGPSLPGSSSILCESSLSVGALLAVVSCSVS